MSKHIAHVFYRWCLSLLMMGAGTVGVLAEDDEGKRDHSPRKSTHRGMDHLRAFRQADTNKDGYLSSEEFAQMKRLVRLSAEKRERIFAFLDKNKDGKLHHRELHPVAPPVISPLVKHFAKIDTDGSGGISFEELRKARVFQKMPVAHIKQLFQKLDRNNNDQLEMHEIRKAEHRDRANHAFQFERHDTDKSGGLSFEEYSAMPLMNRIDEERRKKIFDRLDSNNDQQISKEEIRQARSPHRHRGPGDGAGKPHGRHHDKPRERRKSRPGNPEGS